MLMEQGYAAGWKGFDFLLGTEGYKLQMGAEDAPCGSIHASTSALSPAYFWFSTESPGFGPGSPFAGQDESKMAEVAEWAESDS